MSARFNVRVYGIVINDHNEVLLSYERRNGFEFTKFPGGGVMLGEGIKEALHREFMEELGVQIESSSLFYVNDYYQASAFSQTDQLISFYYKVTLDLNKINTELTQLPLDSVDSSDFERVAWIPLNELSEQLVTFPIDKNVVTILRESLLI